MKSKIIMLLPVMAMMMVMTCFAQESQYDAKFNLTVCTTARNANGELYIKNGPGNTFTGIMLIDNDEREVFGWYVEKISEGGGFIYNTKGLVFYVKIVEEFQHLQLFKALYNYDQTFISGTFFYWGNEFIFYGNKADMGDNPVDPIPVDSNPDSTNAQIVIIIDNNIGDLITISPNPANNTITISSSVILLNNLYCELYSENGMWIKRFDMYSNPSLLDISDIPNGIYLIKLFSNEGTELGTVKIVKY